MSSLHAKTQSKISDRPDAMQFTSKTLMPKKFGLTAFSIASWSCLTVATPFSSMSLLHCCRKILMKSVSISFPWNLHKFLSEIQETLFQGSNSNYFPKTQGILMQTSGQAQNERSIEWWYMAITGIKTQNRWRDEFLLLIAAVCLKERQNSTSN